MNVSFLSSGDPQAIVPKQFVTSALISQHQKPSDLQQQSRRQGCGSRD
jgi:hypothetical protein